MIREHSSNTEAVFSHQKTNAIDHQPGAGHPFQGNREILTALMDAPGLLGKTTDPCMGLRTGHDWVDHDCYRIGKYSLVHGHTITFIHTYKNISTEYIYTYTVHLYINVYTVYIHYIYII